MPKLLTLPPLIVWAAGCLLALAIGLTADGLWRIPLFVGGGAAVLWTWRRFPWSDDGSRYLSFGAAVLLAAALSRLLYVSDTVIGGTAESEWPFFAGSSELAIFKAEVLTIAGTLITVMTWALAGGARQSVESIRHEPPETSTRLLIIIYTMSVVGLALEHLFPGTADALGQLLYTLFGVGLASVFFISILSDRSGPTRVGLAAILCAPFVYFALGTGMKEDLIVSMMPLGYTAWTATRKSAVRAVLMVSAAAVVGLITVYVGQLREDVWSRGNQFTAGGAVTQLAQTTDAQGPLTTISEGLTGFLSRSNPSVQRGWAVALADEYGYEPGLVFGPMLYVFIPRALWPDKPAIRQGWEYNGLLFGDSYLASSESSTATGLYPGFYLGFGWTGVVGGAIWIGLMMAGLLRLAEKLGGGLLVSLFAMSLVPYALRLDENWTVGALSAPIVTFTYLAVILFISRFLLPAVAISLPVVNRAPRRIGVETAPR
jgi:hypothetical protein